MSIGKRENDNDRLFDEFSKRFDSIEKQLSEQSRQQSEQLSEQSRQMSEQSKQIGQLVADVNELKVRLSNVEEEIQELHDGNDIRKYAANFKSVSEPTQLVRGPAEYNRKMYSSAARRRGLTLSYFDQG